MNVSSKFGVCRDVSLLRQWVNMFGELLHISLILVHKSDSFYFQNCGHFVIRREIGLSFNLHNDSVRETLSPVYRWKNGGTEMLSKFAQDSRVSKYWWQDLNLGR